MSVKVENFGKTKDGKAVELYTIENKNGMKAQVMTYGAILVRLFVPDKDGKIDDVVLGFDKVEDYFTNGNFFGATIGPSANRIKDAKFQIDGTTCQLDANDGVNNLHSHYELGYHKQLWNASNNDNSVTFSLEGADGVMGFPGNKKIQVTYTLTEENELQIHYEVVSDKKTVLNLTNHSYFNLGGHRAKLIHDHIMWIKASHYTPVVAGAIPTGEIAAVTGTPMDFTTPKKVGQDINADFEQLKLVQGYDHNWVIDDYDGKVKLIAKVTDEEAGRTMEVYSDLPGVQFYAGNCITPVTGKEGEQYVPRKALCLETQYFPNSANDKHFPQPVFDAGQLYSTTTIYKFI
ncbi:MAG: galactose mutarotase [Lachnospiraceae bacterium]|nr:galactose mutarotase [Lachnospiraceae bacterium]